MEELVLCSDRPPLTHAQQPCRAESYLEEVLADTLRRNFRLCAGRVAFRMTDLVPCPYQRPTVLPSLSPRACHSSEGVVSALREHSRPAFGGPISLRPAILRAAARFTHRCELQAIPEHVHEDASDAALLTPQRPPLRFNVSPGRPRSEAPVIGAAHTASLCPISMTVSTCLLGFGNFTDWRSGLGGEYTLPISLVNMRAR